MRCCPHGLGAIGTCDRIPLVRERGTPSVVDLHEARLTSPDEARRHSREPFRRGPAGAAGP